MKSLKQLLTEEAPVPGQETTINIEAVRIPPYRETYGSLVPLGKSIEGNGLRHPITVWTDGTLISGARRLRVHFLLAGTPTRSQYRNIRAVFVDTVEDAVKRLLTDNGDEDEALPMRPSEVCRLWEVLRQLDAPAAARRMTEARRRGVELRKQTQSGQRQPGRTRGRPRGDEYIMALLGEPFGMAEATASRLWTVYSVANRTDIPEERREKARRALAAIDSGESSIWANYQAVVSDRPAPTPRPRTPAAAAAPSAPAPRQRAAWDRILPQLEGLTAGLAELGPPNSDLTWDQVGPVCTRLMAVRRTLEKTIKQMKESNPS